MRGRGLSSGIRASSFESWFLQGDVGGSYTDVRPKNSRFLVGLGFRGLGISGLGLGLRDRLPNHGPQRPKKDLLIWLPSNPLRVRV